MQTLEIPREAATKARARVGHSWLAKETKEGRPDAGARRRAVPSARSATGILPPEPEVEADPAAIAATEAPPLAVDVLAVRPAQDTICLPFRGSDREVDGLANYLRDAGRSALLTADDEVRLAQEIEAGREARQKLESEEFVPAERRELSAAVTRGEAARQQLISANLRLVVSLAKQHLGPDVEFSDLIQEGNLGLMRAVDRFDWRKGNRFSTYALWWIRQSISCAVSEHSRSIRLPSHMIDSISRLAKTEQRLAQELGRSATNHEVCQALGITIAKLADLRQAVERPCSLDTPIGEDGDGELSELVEDHVAPTPLTAVLSASLRDQIDRVLATLDPRERLVISLRFGLDDDEPRTLEEVGRTLRITKERVRQIEGRAIRKLRNSTRSRWLMEYAE